MHVYMYTLHRAIRFFLRLRFFFPLFSFPFGVINQIITASMRRYHFTLWPNRLFCRIRSDIDTDYYTGSSSNVKRSTKDRGTTPRSYRVNYAALLRNFTLTSFVVRFKFLLNFCLPSIRITRDFTVFAYLGSVSAEHGTDVRVSVFFVFNWKNKENRTIVIQRVARSITTLPFVIFCG